MAHGRSKSVESQNSLRGSPPRYETTEIDPHGATRAASRVGRSFEILNEESPLLSPTNPQDESLIREDIIPENRLDWTDGEAEESKSVWYLFLLTLSIGG